MEYIYLDIYNYAEELKKRTEDVLRDFDLTRAQRGRLPVMSIRYASRDPFPRVVWVYVYGKPGVRKGGTSRFTREFPKPVGYKYRDSIFEPYPEPIRSELKQIERDAAKLRELIKRTKYVYRFARDYQKADFRW
ncbi:conjugative transfer protein MobI(A/C) [Aliiroseovarius sp. 2305UL8-7]|uniref:conjugative transfer protein MobI(A/C) n=1 Tax=Aliiroseovarius conchicola TaxID=3121637 RepID=UPI003526F103